MNKRIKNKKKKGNKVSFNRYYKDILKQTLKHLESKPHINSFRVYINGEFYCTLRRPNNE